MSLKSGFVSYFFALMDHLASHAAVAAGEAGGWVFPAALLGGREIGPSRTKWWGSDRHIVIYYTTRERSEIYFVTSVPEPAEWLTRESWSAKGDVGELRRAYDGFHADVQAVLEACPDCHKWAILERDPLARWSEGRVVLLGDACHPMTPYMAQGAATAIEDAAVLARALAAVEGEDVEGAFRRYEVHRKPRTSCIQAISSANTWMRGGDDDTSWLYGYDAWEVPLDPPAIATRRIDGASRAGYRRGRSGCPR